MDDNGLREKLLKSEAAAREALRKLTNEVLSVTWLATEATPMNLELAVVRGWIADELEARMGPDKFDAWVFANSDVVDPLPYLAG